MAWSDYDNWKNEPGSAAFMYAVWTFWYICENYWQQLYNIPGPEITRTQAHWLQMGGYKLIYVKGEIDAKGGNPYWIKSKTPFESAFSQRSKCLPDEDVWEIVLTYEILVNLLFEDRIDFPNTTEEEIEDRSKGDALSKGMVLLQITWFLGQLVARAHQQLAISQIELTTAALAILNSIVYLFWWNKPLDVRCPIVVRTRKVTMLQLHANGMCQKDCSLEENRAVEGRDCYRNGGSVQGATSKWTFYHFPGDSDENLIIGYISLPYYFSTLAKDFISEAQSLIQHVLLDTAIFLHWPWVKSKIFTIFCTSRSTMHCTETSPSNQEDSSFFIFRVMTWIFISFKSLAKTLTNVLILLTVTPTRTVSVGPTFVIESSKDLSDIRSRIQTKSKLQLLSDRDFTRLTFVPLFYSVDFKPKPLLRFVSSAGASFALIHCLAWNFDFPSGFERILWRTASLSLLGLLSCVFVGTILIRFPYFGNHPFCFTPCTLRLAPYFLHSFFPLAYSFFRISLLVIALLSVRNLPVSAFETVTWTHYIPHVWKLLLCMWSVNWYKHLYFSECWEASAMLSVLKHSLCYASDIGVTDSLIISNDLYKYLTLHAVLFQ